MKNDKIQVLHNDLKPNIDDITELIFNGVYSFTVDETNIFTFTKDKCKITLKYYDELNYNTVDEIYKYASKMGLSSFDIYEEKKFNGEYSIINIIKSSPVNILRYGIYQDCVENYFKKINNNSLVSKSDKINSWAKYNQTELLKESIKLKPIHKNNLFFK